MAASKKYTRHQLPPCPDANLYILVKTEEGYYWRRRRGTVKKATVNYQFAQNAGFTAISSPAASRLRTKLETHTRNFNRGRVFQKIAGAFINSLREKQVIDFAGLYGMELNWGYPLEKLLHCGYRIQEADGHIQVLIPLDDTAVLPQNELATHYYFELITVWGHAAKENSLQSRYNSSALYAFADRNPAPVLLELPLPPVKPWMVLLKIGALEGNETALHYKHYAMKVVGVSGGEVF